mgnify:FL=1
MGAGKKISLILIMVIALAVAGFFVYQYVQKHKTNPDSVQQQPPSSSIDTVKEKEFYDALKKIIASDQDADGIADTEERGYKTDPANADTDSDGLNDWQEIFIYKTDPLKNDTDGDTFLDGYEVRRGYDPKGKGAL